VRGACPSSWNRVLPLKEESSLKSCNGCTTGRHPDLDLYRVLKGALRFDDLVSQIIQAVVQGEKKFQSDLSHCVAAVRACV
jgi:hypothetical protein